MSSLRTGCRRLIVRANYPAIPAGEIVRGLWMLREGAVMYDGVVQRVLTPVVCRSLATQVADSDAIAETTKRDQHTVVSAGDDGEIFTFEPDEAKQSIERAIESSAEGRPHTRSKKEVHELCLSAVEAYERHLSHILEKLDDFQGKEKSLTSVISQDLVDVTGHLLSAEVADSVVQALIMSNLSVAALSKRVRELERLIGSIGMTPITDGLSYRLLEANSNAGNVGRALSLLQLRQARNYRPVGSREFELAIRSISSAGHLLRRERNVYMGDELQPAIDNPTRWLDAILFNMHQRDVPLTTEMANRMLDTYASTGRTGKALHFFYDLTQVSIQSGDHDVLSTTKSRKVARMRFRKPPPYYKVPSLAGDKPVGIPYQEGRKPKLEWESDPEWSRPLAAAFAFADSLMHGACGHAPIELDVVSWNTMIKACCYRGSLWRAFQVLNEMMPRHGVEPDTYSYNTVLAGLARVGDTDKAKELLQEMTNKSMPLNDLTVQALVDGKLNLGDVAGAISLVQDLFNQYCVVPPYTTHLKIMEFALASGLVHEAKRHVYVLQQFWKWEANEYHDPDFVEKMELLKKNPRLSKDALKRLFDYFGEAVEDSDFF